MVTQSIAPQKLDIGATPLDWGIQLDHTGLVSFHKWNSKIANTSWAFTWAPWNTRHLPNGKSSPLRVPVWMMPLTFKPDLAELQGQQCWLPTPRHPHANFDGNFSRVLLLYGSEQDNYKDSTKNHLLQCTCKKALIHQYNIITDKQPFKFLMYYSHPLPPCPGKQVSRQLFLRGCGAVPNRSRYFGGSRGDICHLALWLHQELPSWARERSSSAGLLSKNWEGSATAWSRHVNPNTLTPKALVQAVPGACNSNLPHSIHHFSLFYISFLF